MKRKVRKILFVIALIFASILITKTNKSLAAETTVGDYTYTYDLVDGKAENVYLSNYPEKGAEGIIHLGEITIPNNLDGHVVNSIGKNDGSTMNIFGLYAYEMFLQEDSPTKVLVSDIVLPEHITKINPYALQGIESRARIEIPDEVVEIGEWSFANIHYSRDNVWLQDLVIPNSVVKIGDYAFANFINKFTYSDISEEKTQIYAWAKYWRIYPYGVSTITFGTGLQTIGKYAFANQTHMITDETISIPANVKTIDEGAFLNVTCAHFRIEDRTDTLNIGNYAFACSFIDSLTIKNTYKLGVGVFASSKIRNATFEDGNTIIPESTFYNCQELTNVTKTNSITKIGDKAFYKCDKISNSEYHDIVENITEIGNYAFFDCDGITGNIVVNDYVTKLGTYVFGQCDEILKADIRAPLNEIPDGTFYSCDKLNDVTKLNTITRIGNYTFYDCVSIDTEEYNDIRSNITTIGNYAFSGCTGLTGNIEVADLVENLGEYVFSRCSNISTANLIHNYTKLPNGTFNKCTNLEDVTIKDSITEIGDYAFAECTSIDMDEYDDLARNIIIFGKSAFENCTGLEGTLNIKNIVTDIGEACFRNCTNVTEIKFSNATPYYGKNLGKQCFYKAAKDQEVVKIYAEENSVYIGQRAFTDVKEIFIYTTEDKVNLEYKWYGEDAFTPPYVHYIDCKHYIDITCTLPGIKLVNPTTNETLSSEFCDCESDYSFKLVIEDGYQNKYENLQITVVSEGKYTTSDFTRDILEPENNKTYTLENVIRNKQIIVQAKSTGTDLVLRQFITAVNGKKVREKRIPNIVKNNSGIQTLDYNHTKYPVTAKKGDKITYTIRVYNEGSTEGVVNSLKYLVEDGFKFAENDEVNTEYGWTISDDGKTATTSYLQDKNIEAYSWRGKPRYQDVKIVCIVDKDSDREGFITTVAEIASGNDMDSAENSVTDASEAQSLKTISETSTRDSYTRYFEDDSDFEAIFINPEPKTGYSIVVNKIDSLSSELLNGAKIQLLDSNKELVSEGITENGSVTFSNILSIGEGVDKYYLNEVETPVGYVRTIDGMIELNITKTLNEGLLDLHIECDALDINTESSTINADVDEEKTFIPIYTEAQLAKIGSSEQVTVNGNNYEFAKSSNYKLMNDIEITAESWTPITGMNGIFDGQNHTISGLKINVANGGANTTFEGQNNASGLFANFAGEIRNLNISSASVTGETTGDNPGTGILVGHTTGTTVIVNCNITDSTMSVQSTNVGAFVGHVNANSALRISGCTNSTTINGTYNIGGFVGCIYESEEPVIIENSTNTGAITEGGEYNFGGFVGYIGINRNTEIKNCTNSGDIIPANEGIKASNCGGIVGYQDKNAQTKISKCINSSSNIVGNNNIGGIIGLSEGILSTTECSNSSQVIAQASNAGGIVGQAIPTGTARTTTGIGYDSSTHTITLSIKNKQTFSKYDLNIVKVCGNESLSGAKFNIYDGEKNLIKENAEVNSDGLLQIEDIVVDSLTTDVYFIKETEAPEGYEILVDDYVKVEVTKTWDKENGKYIIGQSTELAEDTEVVEPEEGETAGTGATVEPISSDAQVSNLKTLIMLCDNTGTISALKTDAGGIIGTTTDRCIIEDCSNNAIISAAKYNAGGIAGNVDFLHTLNEKAVISGCTNGTNESDDTTNNLSIGGKDAGGIVGSSKIDLEINDCKNYMKISGEASGGMVGHSTFKLYAHDCYNESIVAGTTAGGIVGTHLAYINRPFGEEIDQEYWNRHDNYRMKDGTLEIEDCEINSSNIGGNRSGGLVGCDGAEKTIVNGCAVKECTIGGEHSGGILGTFLGMSIESNESSVEKLTITGTQVGGFMGSFTSYRFWSNGDGSGYWGGVSLAMDDFTVKGCKIYGNDEAGGISAILPFMGNVGEGGLDVALSNCKICGDGDVKTEIIGSKHTSGIIATGNTSGSIYSIIISDCDVEDAKIIHSGTNQDFAVGILGHLYSGDYYHESRVEITGCNVTRCNIINNGVSMHTRAAGIYSGAYEANTLTNIYDCTVSDTTFDMNEGNAGGILGFMYKGAGINVGRCDVINCAFKYTGDYTSGSTAAIVGGVYQDYSRSSKFSLKIFDCNVKGVSIENARQHASMVLGYSSTGMTGNITNIVIDKYVDPNTGIEKGNLITVGPNTCAVGGVHGGGMNQGGYGEILNIQNIKCSYLTIENDENNNINSGNIRVGGIIGDAYVNDVKSFTIDDVSLEHLNVNLKFAQYTNYTNIGGIAGMLYARNTTLSNITMDDINMTTNGGCLSGGVGFTSLEGNDTFTNITLNNANIKIENSVGQFAVSGMVSNSIGTGKLVDWYTNESVCLSNSISDINIKNTKITLNDAVFVRGGSIVSGVIASSAFHSIDNINVENVEIGATFSENIPDAGLDCNMSAVVGYNNGNSFVFGERENVYMSNINIDNVKINNPSKNGVSGGIIGVEESKTEYSIWENNNSITYTHSAFANIDNSEVKDIEINGKYAVGGLVGCGRVKINNSKVINPVLNGLEYSEGGNKIITTVGGAIGIAVEESILDGVEVTAELPAEGGENKYGVFSTMLAGGIAGVDSGKIINSTVENIIVKTLTKLLTGGENNNENDDTNEISGSDGSVYPYADAIHVQHLEEYENCEKNNVTVICGEEI